MKTVTTNAVLVGSIVALLVVAGIIGVVARGRSGGGYHEPPLPPPPSVTPASLVAICAVRHYDQGFATCRVVDTRLTAADLSGGAEIAYQSHFTSLTTVFQVAHNNADGSQTVDGQYTDDNTSRGDHDLSHTLSTILDGAGVTLTKGATYHITVSNNGNVLGTAGFTYKG